MALLMTPECLTRYLSSFYVAVPTAAAAAAGAAVWGITRTTSPADPVQSLLGFPDTLT